MPVANLISFMKDHGIPLDGLMSGNLVVLVVDGVPGVLNTLQDVLQKETSYEARTCDSTPAAGTEANDFVRMCCWSTSIWTNRPRLRSSAPTRSNGRLRRHASDRHEQSADRRPDHCSPSPVGTARFGVVHRAAAHRKHRVRQRPRLLSSLFFASLRQYCISSRPISFRGWPRCLLIDGGHFQQAGVQSTNANCVGPTRPRDRRHPRQS